MITVWQSDALALGYKPADIPPWYGGPVTSAEVTVQHSYPWPATGKSDDRREFTHVSPAIAHALDQYDADVTSGKIEFGREGFADTYPGMSDDHALGTWIASRVPAWL